MHEDHQTARSGIRLHRALCRTATALFQGFCYLCLFVPICSMQPSAEGIYKLSCHECILLIAWEVAFNVSAPFKAALTL